MKIVQFIFLEKFYFITHLDESQFTKMNAKLLSNSITRSIYVKMYVNKIELQRSAKMSLNSKGGGGRK